MMSRRLFRLWQLIPFCLILPCFALSATDDANAPTSQDQSAKKTPNAGESIKWQVIASGGVRGASTNFTLNGTAGQTAIGKGTSTNFGVSQGFWQNLGVPVVPCDKCGDANSDGAIDISDAVFLISYIFSGGAAPGTCVIPNGMGDANGDGTIDISDAVYLISYIFSGGSTPHC
jgi:hypothetical protein